MSFFLEVLSFISSGLLIPCIALLLVLLLQSLVKASGYVFFYRQSMTYLNDVSNWIHNSEPDKNIPVNYPNQGLFKDYLNRIVASSSLAKAYHLIAEYESFCENRLRALTRMAKLGPIFGLIGTLIPMGPALEGLANGDIHQLASQMQLAFTTTVIGLVIGAIGFSLYQLERQIISRQLATLDCITHEQFDNE